MALVQVNIQLPSYIDLNIFIQKNAFENAFYKM